MTIWRRVACLISKATLVQAHTGTSATRTNTHTHTHVSNIYCFSTVTMVSRMRPQCYVIRALSVLFGTRN